MQCNQTTNQARLRDRRRRKCKHTRQLESRMKNEYAEYFSKMNKYEYDTWLSQVTLVEEEDMVYGAQIIKKEYMLKDLVKKKKSPKEEESFKEIEYDIIENTELDKKICLIM